MPLMLFKEKYDSAICSNQRNIEAMIISSFNKEKDEVDSRYVNLKFVDGNNFIFFTNYDSPKSIAFNSNSQISALFYWPAINIQIRIKAKIKRTSYDYNDEYFRTRCINKNALAISSNQSKIIASYSEVLKKYQDIQKSKNLSKCPKYWGGYSFTAYEIEFWEGSEFRLNKRNLYKKNKASWDHFILEP